MLELLHMTAQYSNAVLVAALPYVSDFSCKLNLPIARPVTMHELAHAGVMPYKGHSDLGIWLANGYWFHVNAGAGFVDSFRAPTDYFYEQREDVTKYAGQEHITTNEVVSVARETLTKLGYDSEDSHTYESPLLEGPTDTPQGHIPYCRVKWKWSTGVGVSSTLIHYVNVDINMESKAVVGMEMFFCDTNILPTSPLKVSIDPELEKDYQKRIHRRMFFDTNAPQRFEPGTRDNK